MIDKNEFNRFMDEQEDNESKILDDLINILNELIDKAVNLRNQSADLGVRSLLALFINTIYGFMYLLSTEVKIEEKSIVLNKFGSLNDYLEKIEHIFFKKD